MISLKNTTLNSIIWTLIDVLFLKGLFFLTGIFLARILGPEEFGLIGMVAVFITVGKSLVDSGMSSSLIRSDTIDNEDLSTVFLMNLGVSILLYVIIYFSAPYVSIFFNQYILTEILRVYCLTFIISAISAVQLAILSREMNFKKLTILNCPGTILAIITGVLLAYNGFGVWSIVWMYIIMHGILSILLWISSNWKPSFQFSIKKMKIHFGFGYKLTVSALLNNIFKNVYNIVIGKYFPVHILGFYERAHSFNQYPASILTGIISKVSFPLLSKIKSDQNRVARIYKQILQFTFFISAPLFLFAAVLAQPLFDLILGEEWAMSATFFQIFCFSFMLYPVQAFNINVLMVYGRSDLFLRLEIIKKSIILISIIIALPFGIYVLVWSSLVVALLALIINTYYSAKMINYNLTSQLRDLFPFLIFAALSAFIMYLSTLLMDFNSLFLQIFSVGLIGVICYLILNSIFKTSPMQLVIKTIKDKIL